MRALLFVLILVPTVAIADPKVTTPTQPLLTPPTFQLSSDPPALPPLSLRLEAVRIAGERADNDWRYPVPGDVIGYFGGQWLIGYGHYRPRTARSASLHVGSMGATMLGQILLESKSPLAGVAALAAGATLDAAAADVDRAAESQRPIPR